MRSSLATVQRPRAHRRYRRQSATLRRFEVERTVSAVGIVSLAGRQLLAAEILAGRRVAIRVEAATLTFFDPASRELLRTRTNPLTDAEVGRLQGARAAGPPPRPRHEPITVQRRASSTGVITVCGQKIALGRGSAHRTLRVHVSETTLAIELDEGVRTLRRTTTKPVRIIKAERPFPEGLSFLGRVSRIRWSRNVKRQVGLDRRAAALLPRRRAPVRCSSSRASPWAARAGRA